MRTLFARLAMFLFAVPCLQFPLTSCHQGPLPTRIEDSVSKKRNCPNGIREPIRGAEDDKKSFLIMQQQGGTVSTVVMVEQIPNCKAPFPSTFDQVQEHEIAEQDHKDGRTTPRRSRQPCLACTAQVQGTFNDPEGAGFVTADQKYANKICEKLNQIAYANQLWNQPPGERAGILSKFATLEAELVFGQTFGQGMCRSRYLVDEDRFLPFVSDMREERREQYLNDKKEKEKNKKGPRP